MLRVLLVVFPISFAAAAQTAPKPVVPVAQPYALRSGHVTLCQIDKGCREEKADGRKYLVMETDGFVLKVASGVDERHGYADVTITNATGAPQQVNPANFRMEESEPRLHRLSYVDPNRRQPLLRAREEDDRPAKLSAPKGLPPPEYWTSGEAQEDRKAKEKPVPLPEPTAPLLRAGVIAPDGTVSGRIYFERPRTADGVSVVLALPGALFEFPCEFPVPEKGRRHRKRQPAPYLQTVSSAATDTTGY